VFDNLFILVYHIRRKKSTALFNLLIIIIFSLLMYIFIESLTFDIFYSKLIVEPTKWIWSCAESTLKFIAETGMSSVMKRTSCLAIALIALLSGCVVTSPSKDEKQSYQNHKEVPGVTQADIEAENFFPFIYTSVSLAALNSKIEPIISVFQKCLDNNTIYELTGLYNEGEQKYLEHKLSTKLTGLRFEPSNKLNDPWHVIFSDLESGKTSMTAELLYSKEREGRFLWTNNPYTENEYALLSTVGHEDINVNQVLHSKVGILKDSTYADIFHSWYPEHPNTVEYENMDDAFAALEKGEIDLLMKAKTTKSDSDSRQI